jgi:peptide/nickel transport system substrate-binding protein
MLAAATAALMGAGLLSATGLPSYASTLHSAATLPELVMESSPETTVTDNFNPYIPSAAPQGMGATGLIYEPLIEFDVAAPPKYYPWLATGYKWSNGGKSITFAIRTGVKWNDGVPMTPADVVYTFNLVKTNAAINSSGLPVASVSSSGNNVTVNFKSPQYTNLQNIAGQAILPQHIWSKVGNPATFPDASPVGTGPYMLSSFSPEGFTLTANPNYWQKSMMPKVPKVFFPALNGNNAIESELLAGKIDWTGNYLPNLPKLFVAKNPAEHELWEAAGGDESLEPNLNVWPLSQLPVRQAINAAISRTLFAAEGEDGLENAELNQTALTLPTFAAWSGPIKNLVNSGTGNPALAKSILEKAGYTLKNGYFWQGSKEVSFSIISPSDYTDMAEVDAIAAQEMRSAGIDATFEGLSVNAWNADVADGSFDMTEHWSNGGITPYNEYDGWLNSALSTGASAKAATGDYEHVDDPALDADITKLAGDSTLAAQTADLVPLEKYIASTLSIIPVTTASEWFEADSDHYTGFPSASDPYETGQPSGTNNGPGSGTDLVVILHLHPRSM